MKIFNHTNADLHLISGCGCNQDMYWLHRLESDNLIISVSCYFGGDLHYWELTPHEAYNAVNDIIENGWEIQCKSPEWAAFEEDQAKRIAESK